MTAVLKCIWLKAAATDRLMRSISLHRAAVGALLG